VTTYRWRNFRKPQHLNNQDQVGDHVPLEELQEATTFK
jgi:hypothetical protein